MRQRNRISVNISIMAARKDDNVCSGTKKVDVANKKKQFRWSDEMIENLITSLHKFKSIMEYKNLDFDRDKTVQYTWLQEELAHVHDNDKLFGPVAPYSPTIRVADMNEKQKLECKARVVKDKEATKKGYSRIKEKVFNFNFPADFA
jgi:hypothetical protein